MCDTKGASAAGGLWLSSRVLYDGTLFGNTEQNINKIDIVILWANNNYGQVFSWLLK